MKHYYGIVYLKNGSACICGACQSEEEVFGELKKAVARQITSNNPPIRTSYITREVPDGQPAPTLIEIFGHPDTRDLLQNKKFMKTLVN